MALLANSSWPCVLICDLDDNLGVARLVRPSEVVMRLSPRISPVLRTYLHQNPEWVGDELARMLGVREEPAMMDWTRCLRAIGKIALGRGLLPSELQAARFAFKMVLKSFASGCHLDDKELWVFIEAQEPRLLPAQELVWPDCQSLKVRCHELQLRFAADVDASFAADVDTADVQLLFKAAGVRPLSKVVTESVVVPTPCQGVQVEQDFADFLQSTQFINDFGRVCCDADGAAVSRFFVTFLALQIVYVSQLSITLSMVGCDDPKSTVDLMAYTDGTSLWIQAGLLDTHREWNLLETLCDEVLPRLLTRSHPTAEIHHKERLMLLLRRGVRPEKPSTNLGHTRTPQPMSLSRAGQMFKPGVHIPAASLRFVQHRLDSTFCEGQTVAVRHGGVLMLAEVVRIDSGAAAGANPLLKPYLLNLGGRSHVQCRHIDVFHLGPSAKGSDRMADGRARWGLLKAPLRLLENLELEDYKRALQRLHRHWHCDVEMEAMLRRHAEAYHGSRDFTWLRLALVESLNYVDAHRTSDQTVLKLVADLFNEFTIAMSREEQGTQQDPLLHASHDAPPRSKLPECGMQDRERAEQLWSESTDESEAAQVLYTHGKEKPKLYDQSMKHSQRALELILQSLMLRTYGLTDDEAQDGMDLEPLARSVQKYGLLKKVTHTHEPTRGPTAHHTPASRLVPLLATGEACGCECYQKDDRQAKPKRFQQDA